MACLLGVARLEKQGEEYMLELTPEDVLATRIFRRAVKTATTKIRPFTG